MVEYFWSLWIRKNSFSENIRKKDKKIKLIDANDINDQIIEDLNNLDCLIIDSFKNNIDEKLLYSIFNQSKQLENYVLINSIPSMRNINFKLEDLKSRIRSLLYIGIELPTDDLLKGNNLKEFI